LAKIRKEKIPEIPINFPPNFLKSVCKKILEKEELTPVERSKLHFLNEGILLLEKSNKRMKNKDAQQLIDDI